jgi:amino acid transporter
MSLLNFTRLKKELSLLDVYVIATGAMISPGIATSHTGPSVVLAYALAGVLIVPAMLSQAELATAMPRAGGAYYFLDRTLGPLVGTIGGVGTWLALILKSAFALIGMGAYLGLVFHVPVMGTAIVFTILFAVLNIVGAKESSGLLRVLVIVLLTILTFFLLYGLSDVLVGGGDVRAQFTPFLSDGTDGLLGTVGLVFVSYIGLTKVASLAEEVKNPDRNIPLGMGLTLATVTGVYVVATRRRPCRVGWGGGGSSISSWRRRWSPSRRCRMPGSWRRRAIPSPWGGIASSRMALPPQDAWGPRFRRSS